MTTNVSSNAKAAETLLQAARIPTPAFDSLKAQYERSAQLLGAGWHGPTDIQTLTGLEGQFLWPEDFFSVRTITFTFDADKVGFQGTYKLAAGLSVVEQGVFYSVPNNPAIGFAAVSLAPQGGQQPRSFIVSGMFTDNNWKIYVGLFNRLGAEGPEQPPFSAVRIG
ncbi:MAG TPA: hypothetical protein VFR86_31090 [Burkholderiaceae bacterium]|nr:hypothetical protein [Burkholderiaceae bacterium]